MLANGSQLRTCRISRPVRAECTSRHLGSPCSSRLCKFRSASITVPVSLVRCQAAVEGKRPDPLGSDSELPTQGEGGGNNGALGGGGKGGGGGGSSGGDSGEFSSGDSGKNGIAQIVAYLYAVLIAVGGYIGYKKKGSKASLQASSILTALLILSGILLGQNFALAMLGATIALGVNIALGWYMFKGYREHKKPFPQGVLSVMSAINILLYIKELNRQYFIWTRFN